MPALARMADVNPALTKGSEPSPLLARLGLEAEPLDARAFHALANRDEAEAFLMRDRERGAADRVWTAFFVESFVEFLIWSRAPFGRIATDDLDWLIGLVGDAPTPSTPALLFTLVRELNEAPARLLALALRHGANRLAAVR